MYELVLGFLVIFIFNCHLSLRVNLAQSFMQHLSTWCWLFSVVGGTACVIPEERKDPVAYLVAGSPPPYRAPSRELHKETPRLGEDSQQKQDLRAVGRRLADPISRDRLLTCSRGC
ncbi:hypothetical protein F5Y10DRAFT_67367 [Nemania abortiva]|nr:hypothetical protein F5Y10DRAFT_67367 [Nemania abortiva]